MSFEIPALWTSLYDKNLFPAHAQQRISYRMADACYTNVDKYRLTFFLRILGVSQNVYELQLTPICIGVLEHMDSSWYPYCFDWVYIV